MLTPVTSEGSRSGVNCRRSKPQLNERASDFASIVLPTPGTSSIRMWPRLSSAMTQSSISTALPTSTRPTFSTIREPSASTDPFSTCILFTSFSVIRSPWRSTTLAVRTRPAVGSLPYVAPPGYTGGQTPNRRSAQDEDVVDHQTQGVQPRRSQRAHGAHGAGELLDHD